MTIYLSGKVFCDLPADEQAVLQTIIAAPKKETDRWSWIAGPYLFSLGEQKLTGFRIDLYTGDLYLHPTAAAIRKNIVISLAPRLLQIFLKTLYHIVLPLSTFFACYQARKEGIAKGYTMPKIVGLCLLAIANNVLDIFKTPLYGLAIVIVQIAALCIYSYSEDKFITASAIAGAIEISLLHGQKKEPWKDLLPRAAAVFFTKIWFLTPCMASIDNIAKVSRRNRHMQGHHYGPYSSDSIGFGLANLGYSWSLEGQRANKIFPNTLGHC
jgi:hypothetical protein